MGFHRDSLYNLVYKSDGSGQEKANGEIEPIKGQAKSKEKLTAMAGGNTWYHLYIQYSISLPSNTSTYILMT